MRAAGMEGVEVLRVLDALETAGVRAGITGGWGIDALLRRETRQHGDLDLGVAVEDVDQAIKAVRPMGYVPMVDERPARAVVESDAREDVDAPRGFVDVGEAGVVALRLDFGILEGAVRTGVRRGDVHVPFPRTR